MCLEKTEGGRARDDDDGEAGEGQTMASPPWRPWQGLEMSSPNSGNPSHGFNPETEPIQVTFEGGPCSFPPMTGKSW